MDIILLAMLVFQFESVWLKQNMWYYSYFLNIGRITELFRPSFSKTRVLKIQIWVKQNRTLITQIKVSIFQIYSKTMFLYKHSQNI